MAAGEVIGAEESEYERVEILVGIGRALANWGLATERSCSCGWPST